NVTQGAGTSLNVTVASQNGFNGTVNLSVGGFASGASCSFNPPSITGSGSSTLTITAAGTAQTGTFTLNITGTSGSLSHVMNVMLTVNAAGGGAPITQVQSNGAEGTALASLSVPFLANNHAGNL